MKRGFSENLGGDASTLTLTLLLPIFLSLFKVERRDGAGARGVSYIISVMVMALVITSLAGVVMYWGMGQVSVAQSEYSAAISADLNRIKERIVVEHVAFNPPNKATIYVRNVGSVPAVVDAVYFNDTRITLNPPLQLGLGAGGSYTVTTPPYQRGSVVNIAVSTQRGNMVAAYWKVK